MILPRNFHVSIRALHDGLISFEQFRQATLTVWTGLAAYLRRRWVPPASVSVDDVCQELLLAAWQFIPRWDPSRPDAKSLADYAVWNACNKAKYYLHQQRGANLHGNYDANPSCIPTPFSALKGDSSAANRFAAGVANDPSKNGVTVFSVKTHHEPNCDENIDRRRLIESAMVGANSRICVALAALSSVEGSIDGATALLYDDSDCRAALRLGSKEQARSLVRKAAKHLAQKFNAA